MSPSLLLFLNSSATDIVFVTAQARQLKQQLRSAQVAGQWRGDTALTLPLFWQRPTVSLVFFGRYPLSTLHSFVLFHPPPPPHTHTPLSPSPISNLASVDVKQYGLYQLPWVLLLSKGGHGIFNVCKYLYVCCTLYLSIPFLYFSLTWYR